MSDLATKLQDAVGPAVEHCQVVKDRLEGLCVDWGIDAVSCARTQTAGAVLALLPGLAADDDAKRRVEVLAHAEVQTSIDAMGTGYRKSVPDKENKVTLRTTIDSTKWELFEAVAGLSDDRKAAADGVIAQLTEAIAHDEYAIALQPRLLKLERDAIRLLTPTKPKPKACP